MKKKLFLQPFAASMLLLIVSCQKAIDKPVPTPEEPATASNSSNQQTKKKVYVSTLEELYAAVNHAGNAGAEVNLAPGTYVLNASYPNGGRLELQTDMSLKGQPGQIDAVFIDQSLLPISSYRLTPTVTVAPIRVGRGTNSLQWLSVKGGPASVNPLSVIESDLLGNETNITISHVYVDCNGSRTGIMFRNRLEEHANRVINASLEHTEITNAISNPNPPGAGLAIQNRISGAQIKLTMKDNYIHSCRVGVVQFNSGLGNTVENCSFDFTSQADRIEGNGCGIDLVSGVGAPPSNNNTVTVKMYGSSISGNGQPQFPPNNGALLCGLDAGAGRGSNHVASNNTLNASFWGCNISNNNGTDIFAYGAFSPSAFIAGINNRFDLYLYGISANAIVDAHASIPAEPAGTNVVNVYR